jgi:predicted DCC family thiol-disulfide oxidoreductase YuxK
MPRGEKSHSGQPEMPISRDYATLLFDGVCNLCNGWVDFVIRRDPRGNIRFAALQSPAGRKALQEIDMSADYLDSIILLDTDGRILTASSAVLTALRKMKWPWPLLFALVIVPKPIRDFIYQRVARSRYRWFGKRDTCRVPAPEEEERFL